jgi:ring-1,2-phenylacetyl-CoA epoxidase subunit PaaE
MAYQFHSLKIREIIKETTECVSIYFDVPTEIAPSFTYKEGQNITIKKTIQGNEIRRSYSICAAPFENKLKIAVKKVDGGMFSTFANDELSVGDELEVMPPSGRFNAHLLPGEKGNYLAIAAGSGITPIISIIKHTLHVQPQSKVTLMYGSKNRNAIIFFEELESLKNKYIERFTFINILSKEKTDTELFHGRVNEEKLHSFQKIIDFGAFDAAYLCGPESMIKTSSDFLINKGLDKSNIHFELFTTSNQFVKSNPLVNEVIASGQKSNITIKVDGRSFTFDLPYNGNSILDEALQQGADLPYACKGGVCCTCRAKLLEGNVSMEVNYALEQEEVEQGFILTCQAHPISDKVVIDFDEK